MGAISRRVLAELMGPPLLGSEDTVAGIAETRNDVPVFIQMRVDGGRVDVHIGVGGLHLGESFWGAHKVKTANLLAAMAL